MSKGLLLVFFLCSLLFTLAPTAHADITAGLVGHWKFDEGSGPTANDSAGANIGTLVGGPTWTAGKVGSGALQFDGVDDEVDIPTGPVLTTDGTLAGWFNWDSSGGANQSLLRDNTTGGGGWILAYSVGGDINFRFGGTTFDTNILVAPYRGKWTHWAASKAGTTAA